MDEILNVKKFDDITRSHWHMENKLHWILDVHFKEDLSKSNKDNSKDKL